MAVGFAAADRGMDAGFARVDTDIREIRGDMKAGFERFDKKFDRLMWGLVVIGSGVIPALLGLIGSLVQNQIS